MNKVITLKAKIREITGKKVKKLREESLIPAVLYGHETKPQNILVNYLDFGRVYEKAGENALVELEIGGKKTNVLVHDTQKDPMSGNFSHVDFFQVNMKEEVETEIPLEFIGESPAVKELGGILVKSLDEITVKCLPADLPEKYEVDISKLITFDDVIAVKDLKVSDKIEILIDNETIIASVQEPRTLEELESLEAKVEEDVSKVEGVVKETPSEATAGEPENKEK
ncbi:MAG TPA: 50S ribosomal protein L25 [Candidatus Moranbacteria bacterium]|nr:50S ribosomal protein L25 [Candidatus Moranbacteria bacterium]HRZ34077.1 50S ribosomal protein L25 [Candidatus Moranbacteria bacterium]